LAALEPTIAFVRSFGSLVADSARMHEVFNLLGPLSKTDLTVTLIGETGTGKDVLAHTLHEESLRAQGPFVVFDCGAVAPNLAESELFGHERGSFTGAFSGHAGAFERAHGGTLFLDEIGELPLDLQPRLLRVLETRRVRRVGGSDDRSVDVRIIAATNCDLSAGVQAGKFRQDLYFRLAGAIVPVPPLRDRLEDLPLLVPRLLEDLGAGGLGVSQETYAVLRAHAWPGNVRELKNTLGCALAFVRGDVLEPAHLRLHGQSDAPPRDEDAELAQLALGGLSLQRIERAAIKQTLAQTNGNRVLAARSLGIAVSTLYEKLKKYNL
jgi:transcriptional regulator with PAS, ATPase and Fis domain